VRGREDVSVTGREDVSVTGREDVSVTGREDVSHEHRRVPVRGMMRATAQRRTAGKGQRGGYPCPG
jgi:hypothetical protein